MGIEIERKFLVKDDSWRTSDLQGVYIKQGYLKNSVESVVRIRIAQGKGFLTIKGITVNASRREFEYEIPLEDADILLDELCEKPLIEKIRYTVWFKGFKWEIDEFFCHNKGLIVAEIELDKEERVFEYPEWVGREVTCDPSYFNSNLTWEPKPS